LNLSQPRSEDGMPQLPLNSSSPEISVIIPVYNGGVLFQRCLEALCLATDVAWECIVVDDGSTDGSGELARRYGGYVVDSDHPRSGPGQARNLGARLASSPLLCFVDADVQTAPDTLAQFVALFASDPGLTAAFGSYDSTPAAQAPLSRYRNLLHYFVHQEGALVASTFWAGCGAIRREAFLSIGGFHPVYRRPSIEDIEMGYRLRAAGGRIRLAKHIQVKHLKHWTLLGIVKTDIFDRALPWTMLIARTGRLPNDLNLQTASRASAASVFLLLALLALGYWQPLVLLATPLPLAVLVKCNLKLYRFLLAQGGGWFLLRSLPMHWLYYAYSALAFAGGMTVAPLLLRRSGGSPHRSGAAGGVARYPLLLPPLRPWHDDCDEYAKSGNGPVGSAADPDLGI
jgi:hypothetical protein